MLEKRFFPTKNSSERVQCKHNEKHNTKMHGNSKESQVRTQVHKHLNI